MKRICILLAFLVASLNVCIQARDVYVTNSGGVGDGDGTPTNPVTFSRLLTLLKNHSGDNEVNVYFSDGDYPITSNSYFTFSSGSYNFNFTPLTPESKNVRFTGNGSVIKLAETNTNNILTLTNISINNFYTTSSSGSGSSSLFTVRANSQLNIENCIINQISSSRAPLFITPGGYANIVFSNSEITNIVKLSTNDATFAIQETEGDYSNVSFTNCILDKWTTNASSSNTTYSHMFWWEHSNNVLSLTGSTISNCKSNNSLIYANSSNTITISGCTFTGNTTGNTGSSYNIIVDATYDGATFTIYNNTFYGNSINTAISATRTSHLILNNTIYNSGTLSVNANPVVRNNLVFGTSSISGTNANAQRNISQNSYYESGLGSGVSVGTIERYVSTVLMGEGPGKEVLQLLDIKEDHPIIKKGLANGYETYLLYDQTGKKRPDIISIGSVDLPDFSAVNGSIVIIYDPQSTPSIEPSTRIDLASYITSYPEGADAGNISYTIIQQPTNGSVSPSDQQTVYFKPTTDKDGQLVEGTVGVSSEMVYTVQKTISGIDYAKAVKVKITIINIRQPGGIIDESIIRCYEDMKPVETFNPKWKFRTHTINSTYRYDGFTIPLVGDLNGDGKPEIVVTGISHEGTGSALDRTISNITILDGSTGRVIVRYPLPVTYSIGGSHNTPSHIALVDADRNGRAEIILAYGYNSGNTTYSKRLVSYEVNENTFLSPDRLSVSDKSRLDEKWISNARYDAFSGGVHNSSTRVGMPLPQIVDINQDGDAEVVVYNKVYSALNGKLLAKLEDLGTEAQENSTSYSTYKSKAFTGRNRHATNSSDSQVNFSCIYDLDQDGIFEVIAGGKVYYDIDFERGDSKVKSAENIISADGSKTISIGDGYTGVADINGDGKAEIVVVGYYEGTSRMFIQVWDPGFMVSDGKGGWIKAADPQNTEATLLAESLVPFNRGDAGYNGSLSHVYIGDIDGAVQNGKKHPEISILGSRFYGTNGGDYARAVPVHPNANETDFPLAANGRIQYTSGSYGSIMSWTWDDGENISIDERLKVSFVLEHADQSLNTGFTLFDFDNDGIQDICYRDEKTLRIISAKKSYVKVNETITSSPEVIRFRQDVRSWTGFEYPVIADIDGDGSANMVVMGSENSDDARGYIYALQQDPLESKAAPALKVWNQFMYHPLKINEDLATPYVNLHPLAKEFYYMLDKDKEESVLTPIYNSTITQVAKSAVFEIPVNETDTIHVVKPVVPVPDAVVEGKIDVQEKTLSFYITNIGDATLNGINEIRIYADEINAAGRLTQIGDQNVPPALEADVYVGDTLSIVFTNLSGPELGKTYIFRVSDASPLPGEPFVDLFMKEYSDCNWANNITQVGTFVPMDDAATVTRYGTIEIDLFENDILPEDFAFKLTEDMITALSSTAYGTWEIIGNKFRFTASGSYEGGVVEFKYALNYSGTTKEATIYIYIIQSTQNSFALCSGTSFYRPSLRYLPEDIIFHWQSVSGENLGQEAPLIRSLEKDTIFYVRPDFINVSHPDSIKYKLVNFPYGKLVISVLPEGVNMYTAKWVGAADTDWYNPANWMQVDSKGSLYPVDWAPGSCVNVIIAKEATYYPELYCETACAKITMEDCTMIAGIHWLEYEEAQVELSLKSTERERFVMWSPPMKDMYTGDFHFRVKDNKPVWDGDVYMNFFQAGNPDGGNSMENAFTATFGHVGTKLPVEQSFNIKVESRISDKVFVFPKSFTKYEGEDGILRDNLVRENAHRFILDRGDFELNGVLQEIIDMPVSGENEYAMIQVVNPFMAYLDMAKFLEANAGDEDGILEKGYKVWDGRTENGFITVKYDDEGQRYYITDPSAVDTETTGYIPPLQSFLVMKKNNTPAGSLKMSAMWTTTLSEGKPGNYLRKSEDDPEQHILRVMATTAGGSNSTLLYYDDMAIPEYKGDEDVRKLFNPESNLEVYTFASTNEPLDFHASGDYTSRNVRLGIRMDKAQPLTLEFTGMERFRHDVYLIDHDNGEHPYNLSRQNVLTFNVDSYSTGKGIDLPNRFSLSFEYTGMDIGNEVVPENDLVVVSSGSYLNISAGGKEIENLQVYNLWGQRVYQSQKPGTHFKVRVESNQFYIVKGQVNYQIRILKAIAR